jgi:glutathione S-transferase
MSFDPSNLTITNPVFHAYVLAASLMLLKLMLQPWMTVQRMMKVHAGFRSPEDARQTPLNPDPFGKILIWTYVGTRAAHFLAYATAQIHDIRATLWTFSSLSVLVMTGYVLVQAI